MEEQSSPNELISAFLDEELADSEIDALLAQLECPDNRERACRLWLVDSALRERRALPGDLSSRVREAITAESQQVAPEARVVDLDSRRRWRGRVDWKIPAGGLAVAASAALVAVMVVKPAAETAPERIASQPLSVAQQQLPAAAPSARSATPARLVSAGQPGVQPGVGSRELVIAAPTQPRPVVAQWGSAESDARTVSSSTALREQMNTYLLNHARSGGGTALSGSLGYARMAASPQQQRAESSR